MAQITFERLLIVFERMISTKAPIVNKRVKPVPMEIYTSESGRCKTLKTIPVMINTIPMDINELIISFRFLFMVS